MPKDSRAVARVESQRRGHRTAFDRPRKHRHQYAAASQSLGNRRGIQHVFHRTNHFNYSRPAQPAPASQIPVSRVDKRASEFRAAYGCRRTAHHRKSRRLVRQPANNRHRRRRACAVGKPPHRVHPAISAANSGVSRGVANLSGKFPKNDAGAGAGHGSHARH